MASWKTVLKAPENSLPQPRSIEFSKSIEMISEYGAVTEEESLQILARSVWTKDEIFELLVFFFSNPVALATLGADERDMFHDLCSYTKRPLPLKSILVIAESFIDSFASRYGGAGLRNDTAWNQNVDLDDSNDTAKLRLQNLCVEWLSLYLCTSKDSKTLGDFCLNECRYWWARAKFEEVRKDLDSCRICLDKCVQIFGKTSAHVKLEHCCIGQDLNASILKFKIESLDIYRILGELENDESDISSKQKKLADLVSITLTSTEKEIELAGIDRLSWVNILRLIANSAAEQDDHRIEIKCQLRIQYSILPKLPDNCFLFEGEEVYLNIRKWYLFE